MKNILVVFGTRPEVIKLAPLILELQKHPQSFEVMICNSGQQKELSQQTLKFFNLNADFNLDVMEPNQSLIKLQSKVMLALQDLNSKNNFDAIIVQGDTMTAFCGALFGFLNKIPVFHVEAGLRSYNLQEPFPEEGLRQMISRVANLHFAPTKNSIKLLEAESISSKIIIETGNTVIDALFCLSQTELSKAREYFIGRDIKFDDNLVLITIHRRENHGERLEEIIAAIKFLSDKFPDHVFIIPVHPNPNVKEEIYSNLSGIDNIILEDPLSYPCLVFLMQQAKLILTDSGGIQEEAPSFGCPVLILRHETERKEGVEAGFAELIGTKKEEIIRKTTNNLNLEKKATRLDGSRNPYGDGLASKRIVGAIKLFFKYD